MRRKNTKRRQGGGFMESPVTRACAKLITMFKANRTKFEKELIACKKDEPEEGKVVSIVVKGVEYSNYEELQEAYGIGELSLKEMEHYWERLQEEQSKVLNESQVAYYEALIRMITNILSNVEYAKKQEEDKEKRKCY